MATVDYTDGITVIPAAWLNDLDAFYYEKFVAGGLVCIGDTTNANMSIGITINQLANDDEILAFKSSDVAHGITDVAETDTFGNLKKLSPTAGGAALNGFSEGTTAVSLSGYATTADTTKSVAGIGAVRIIGLKKSGTSVASLGADSNILSVDDNGTTRFILDADGDSHQDVGTAWNNFDEHDDIALLNATSALLDPSSLRRDFTKGFLTKHKKQLEKLGIVTFNKDGHHFINWSRFQMLHMGATRWLADRLAVLETKVLECK